MRNALSFLVFFICISAVSLSQEAGSGQSDPQHPSSNTASTGTDTVSPDSASVHSGKSPLGAVLRSAILPGLGQFYNEAYWKVPVVLGLTGFLIYGVVTEHATYTDYRDQYDASITTDVPSGNLRLKLFREFYRDRRDTYAWWLLIAYLFQIADAFVDAHLYSFDIGDVDALQLLPAANGLRLQLRF
ncbi:MAG: DUF5683 domain-containing protein [Bacteroidia bacterium]|nr:DUF5683 domain-containing protein [Bacteroidia bacterium]